MKKLFVLYLIVLVMAAFSEEETTEPNNDGIEKVDDTGVSEADFIDDLICLHKHSMKSRQKAKTAKA